MSILTELRKESTKKSEKLNVIKIEEPDTLEKVLIIRQGKPYIRRMRRDGNKNGRFRFFNKKGKSRVRVYDHKEKKTNDGKYYKFIAWRSLTKSWTGYNIALRENDIDKMKHYATLINEYQRSLELPIEQFICLSE